ncbi:MAG: hypothetical protein K0B52_01125 [FCB group bacterium]|nr:hypothetical protein [FCB group bacterium]
MPYLPTMKRNRHILLILMLILSGCSRYDSIKAVYVPIQSQEIRQRYGGEMGALADALKEAKVTLVISPVLEHGTAYYPSDMLPQRWEYGTQLLAFRHELRRRNIRFAAHIPLFRDAYTHRSLPHLRAVNNYGSRIESETRYAICPSDKEYQEYKIRIIAEIMLILQPDVLYFDDLHFPLNPEDITTDISGNHMRSYCFCPACLEAYGKHTGESVPIYLTTADNATRILNEQTEAWAQWKCSVIGSFLNRTEKTIHTVHPECRIMVALLPGSIGEHAQASRLYSGQDIKLLSANTDYFTFPVAYTSPEDFHTVFSSLTQTAAMSEIRLVPCFDLHQYSIYGQENERDFQRSLKQFRQNVLIHDWDYLLKNRSFLNIFSLEP